MLKRRPSWWQQVLSWTERQRDARTIRRALKPYLSRRDAFVPQPPREDLEEVCREALTGIHSFPRIEVWGNADTVPSWPFQTVGKKLAYHFHRRYVVPLGYRKAWIEDLLRQILHRRFGHYSLPNTLYGRDSTMEILHFFAAAALDGSTDQRLVALMELASSGNELAYIGGTPTDLDVLYVRCELTAPRRVVVTPDGRLRTVPSIPRPVPT